MFQAHVNIEDLDSLEDVEHCVIYFNQAVLLYHLKQYSTALKIMQKVFSFIEPMGKKLSISRLKQCIGWTVCLWVTCLCAY
jgi:CCR4-NOT transcription complex subunit 10